jgi:low temperature requirement protein LtrA
MSGLLHPPSLRLPNEKDLRHATWLELFFDLIFAVMVTQLAARLLNHLSYLGVLQCMALFIPSWWTWVSYTVFAARFDNNDIIHWLMTFVIMFAAAIMAIQIPTVLEGGSMGFAIGFLVTQVSLILLYWRAIYNDSTPKNIIFFYIFGFGFAGIFWVISLFFVPPLRFIFWTIGMSFYLVLPWLGRKRILSHAPLDTNYIPERFGAFTIIIIGQTMASVVFGLESANWDLTAVVTGIMAFILAIILWGKYYRFAQLGDYRCTLKSGQPYIYSHIPFIISLLLIGVCAEDFIKSSHQVHENVNRLFCFATILWLASFYLLQYMAIPKFKIQGRYFIIAIVEILFLFFFYPLSPLLTLSGLIIIFIMLSGLQYWDNRSKE